MNHYKFKKSDGGPISKRDAEGWIGRYKKKHPNGPWAFFFGEDIINKIVDHPEAVGMRIYFGYADDNDKLQLILVGTREDGTNIWPDENGKDSSSCTAGDAGLPCPPYCP